jgi:hypothetical protein
VQTCAITIGIHCMGMALPTSSAATSSSTSHSGSAAPDGYTPADLASAYSIPKSNFGTGSRPIVAVVDAYHAPNAYADLEIYRQTFGLSFNGIDNTCALAQTNLPSDPWCFKQVDQDGNLNPTGPIEPYPGDFSWADETTLDVEMVAAICPQCRILLVEANNADTKYDVYGHPHPDKPNMEKAVQTAVHLGAQYVSMSWGQSEYPGELADNTNYYNPNSNGGVLFVAAAGDDGYTASAGGGAGWPASSANVVTVGGTTLTRSLTNSRGWTETAWGEQSPTGWVGTGSGCSAYETRPVWQSVLTAITSACSKRIGADVSIVADPNTGVAVYDSPRGGWQVFGGTSAGTPMVAALFALAQNNTDRSAPYEHPDQFHDVGTGRNTPSRTASCGIACFAGVGWDGPTGLGTPAGIGGFAAGGLVLHNPGVSKSGIGRRVAWRVSALGTSATYAVTSGTLPSGLTLGSDGVIRGATRGLGGGRAVITATNGARSGTTVLLWQSLHVFHVTRKPQIKGTVKVGSTVRTSVGTVRRDSARGPVVRPAPKVQWLKDGKPIPGATRTTLRITSNFAGHRISYRYTLRATNYLPSTLVSNASRQVR